MPSQTSFYFVKLAVYTLWACSLHCGTHYVRAQAPDATQAENLLRTELWYGTLETEQRQFRFAVEIKASDNAKWTGTLLSLDEGGARFDLTKIARDAKKFSFELPSTGADFSSELGPTGKTANGKWRQRGQALDMNFEQVEAIPTQEFTALWVGKLDALIQKLDIAILELANGKALLDSVSQKASGFVGQVVREGNKVTFTFPALNAEFRGEADEAGHTLIGKWKQGFASLNLALTQRERIDAKPLRRPQTPQPPFPYQVRNVEFENSSAKIRLSGTLTLPPKPSGKENFSSPPIPAVVLISGSGPQDRDETIAEHRPFAVLADHLTRAGLAVLRFDDRGVGQSQGDFSKATSVDFASDVLAAVDFLRQQPEIDRDHIALCGHSEGGIIAPLAAVQDANIAGIVLLAGTGVNGEQILVSQNRLILTAANTPEPELTRQLEVQQAMIAVATQSPIPSADEFKLQVAARLETHLGELDATARSQLIDAAAAQLLSPWFQTFLKHEPQEVLSRVRCPVLALCGEKDLQVDPSLNLPAIEAALTKGGNQDFTVKLLPGLNHLFQTCTSGAVSEYGEIEETIAPQVLEIVTAWLQEHLK